MHHIQSDPIAIIRLGFHTGSTTVVGGGSGSPEVEPQVNL